MKSSDAGYLNIGPRLTLAFAALIALILGGNGLVIWQFHTARVQTQRLTGANQQLIAVLQLQVSLLSFHERLDNLARSGDAQRLATEAEPLRRVLRERTQQTRMAIANLPPETWVDPAFLPTIESVEGTLLAQLDAINELAKSGEWATLGRRLDYELKPIETQTSVLVGSVDRQANSELREAVARMGSVLASILIIVPATAISTFCIAAFLGWSVARRMIELRWDERVSERLRITHELHDTLLQTIQASRMIAGIALEEADPIQQRRALERLSTWLDRAGQEGRAALNSLQASTVESNDLADAFRQAIEDCRGQTASEVSFAVVGNAREMHPIVRDEIYRIGYEAIRNACAHAHASLVEVRLGYANELALSVKDNGVGIEPAVLERGKEGHFGLEGMRQRAGRIGGRLTLTSTPGVGTEVKLVVPGRIIFRSIGRSIGPAWVRLLGKLFSRVG
ncbi:MAG TPA: ATP-binding protein [Bryobacteraceae bacterium]|nr:ATP-binding protein [Bryobacteraceae bacterium]